MRRFLPFLLPAFVAAFIPTGPLHAKRSTPLFGASKGVELPEEIRSIKPLDPEDYIAVGLACCFKIDPDTQKPKEAYIFEPLTAGTLETLALGVPTSYKRVMALTCGELFVGDTAEPKGVNVDALKPLLKSETATECEDMVVRSLAAARTFRRRVEAQILAPGELADDFNFNTDKKRILNYKYEPSFEDNVKQDISIDVYGRKDEEKGDINSEIERLANL